MAVFRRTIRSTIRGILRRILRVFDTAPTRRQILFNGVDQYGYRKIDWTATSVDSGYHVKFTTGTANTGVAQHVLYGETTGIHALKINASGQMRVIYVDTLGATQSFVIIAAPTDNTTYDIEVKYSAVGVQVLLDGTEIATSSAPPEPAHFSTLGAQNSLIEKFNGGIEFLYLNDNSDAHNGYFIEPIATVFTRVYIPVAVGDITEFTYIHASGTTGAFFGSELNSYPLTVSGSNIVGINAGALSGTIDGVTISINSHTLIVGQSYAFKLTSKVGATNIMIIGADSTESQILSGVISNFKHTRINGETAIYALSNKPGNTGIDHAASPDLDILAEQSGSAAVFSENLYVPDNPTLGAGWSDNGDGTFFCDGSQTSSSNIQQNLSGTVPNNTIVMNVFELISITAGNVGTVFTGSTVNGLKVNTIGEHFNYEIVDVSLLSSGVQADANFIGIVRPISLRITTKGLIKNFNEGIHLKRIHQNNSVYLINEGTGDILHDLLNRHRMKYHMDVNSDYITIPPIALLAGDTISYKYISPGPTASFKGILTDSINKNIFWHRATQTFGLDGATATVDGIDIIDGITPTPEDERVHDIVVTITTNTTLDIIGTDTLIASFYEAAIFDLEILATNGNRYYAVDEGEGNVIKDSANPEIDLLPTTPSNINTPWIDNLDGTFTCDGTQANNANIFYDTLLPSAEAGVIYSCILEIIDYTSGTLGIVSGSDLATPVTGNGIHELTLIKGGSNTHFNWQADANFTATIRPISVINNTSGEIINSVLDHWIDDSPTDIVLVNDPLWEDIFIREFNPLQFNSAFRIST